MQQNQQYWKEKDLEGLSQEKIKVLTEDYFALICYRCHAEGRQSYPSFYDLLPFSKAEIKILLDPNMLMSYNNRFQGQTKYPSFKEVVTFIKNLNISIVQVFKQWVFDLKLFSLVTPTNLDYPYPSLKGLGSLSFSLIDSMLEHYQRHNKDTDLHPMPHILIRAIFDNFLNSFEIKDSSIILNTQLLAKKLSLAMPELIDSLAEFSNNMVAEFQVSKKKITPKDLLTFKAELTKLTEFNILNTSFLHQTLLKITNNILMHLELPSVSYLCSQGIELTESTKLNKILEEIKKGIVQSDKRATNISFNKIREEGNKDFGILPSNKQQVIINNLPNNSFYSEQGLQGLSGIKLQLLTLDENVISCYRNRSEGKAAYPSFHDLKSLTEEHITVLTRFQTQKCYEKRSNNELEYPSFSELRKFELEKIKILTTSSYLSFYQNRMEKKTTSPSFKGLALLSTDFLDFIHISYSSQSEIDNKMDNPQIFFLIIKEFLRLSFLCNIQEDRKVKHNLYFNEYLFYKHVGLPIGALPELTELAETIVVFFNQLLNKPDFEIFKADCEKLSKCDATWNSKLLECTNTVFLYLDMPKVPHDKVSSDKLIDPRIWAFIEEAQERYKQRFVKQVQNKQNYKDEQMNNPDNSKDLKIKELYQQNLGLNGQKIVKIFISSFIEADPRMCNIGSTLSSPFVTNTNLHATLYLQQNLISFIDPDPRFIFDKTNFLIKLGLEEQQATKIIQKGDTIAKNLKSSMTKDLLTIQNLIIQDIEKALERNLEIKSDKLRDPMILALIEVAQTYDEQYKESFVQKLQEEQKMSSKEYKGKF